ncbi:MAG: hypothetical protein O4859_04400 [Trichodesmium sp. St18_bin1]|nr:hypothetical protein [Trichodesmium sp. St18_bin1]
MKSSIISRFAVVSGLVVCSTLGLATVARAGEGGTAGSTAFTVDSGGKVTGVAVSAAVGKENASAAAFNYESGSGLQNSAWSLGTAGTQDFTAVGDANGFNVTSNEDSARGTEMTNSFSADPFSIKLGTTSGDSVVD